MEAFAKVSFKKVKGATLYVVRVNKDGTLGNSKPCKNCTKFIVKLGIRKVIYST